MPGFADVVKAIDEDGNLRTIRVYDHYRNLESLHAQAEVRIVELDDRTPLRP